MRNAIDSATYVLRRDVAQLLANQIELGDRLAELLALARELHAQLQAVLGAAHGADAQLPAADVQDVEGDLVPLADRPQHGVDRDRAVLEEQRAGRAAADAQLVLLGADRQAGRAALDQERGELLAVDLREHREQVREAGVGDVQLRPGQLPALAVGGLAPPWSWPPARPSPSPARSARRRRCISPLASLGRYFCRCSGVPNRTSGMVPMPTCAPKLTAYDPCGWPPP